EKSEPVSYEIDKFGANTYIFEETDSKDAIQGVMDAAYDKSEAGQFGTDRYAFMFKPSEQLYDVTVNVGFYTQVAGLGISPEDVKIKQLQCLANWMLGRKGDGTVNHNALCNFWRSAENFSSPSKYTIWAVSQATSMRRMNFYGSDNEVVVRNDNGVVTKKYNDPNYGLLVMNQDGGYASGGFLADSKVATQIQMGSQQQWISRNTESGAYAYDPNDWNYQQAVWNDVLVGSKTSIKDNGLTWNGVQTVVDKTPVIAERPFLMYNEDLNEYGLFVPALKKQTAGVSWENIGEDDYTYISINDCYVAKPGESADEINAGVATKKALIFTPGIYELDKAIEINNADTVVLGLGYATIKPTNGNQCMTVADVDGVRIAGVLFDAGRVESKALLTVGTTGSQAGISSNPVVLSDCFFRVGGADREACKTKACVIINTNEVICDNFWVWRADHGSGVAWNKNTCDNGVIFNGKNITAYGLMVEHFQKVQTQWNADGGRCYMYQSELPYDIASQSVWNEPGSYGYTDYKVAKNVKSHEGYGLGIYSCYQAAQCYLKSAITCPDTEGVKFKNVVTTCLSGNGTIDKVINDAGYVVLKSVELCRLTDYCNGKYTLDRTGNYAKKMIFASAISVGGKRYIFDKEMNVTYKGKPITKRVEINMNGVKLREGIDYKVTYKNNDKIGDATLRVVGIGSFRCDNTYTIHIKPAKVTVAKKTATKKKIKLAWKKVTGATGYEIKYSTSKKFDAKTTKVKKTKNTSFTIKRKSKKSYIVKIRAYKKVGKKYYYGDYSNKLNFK
ncbi:MAG: hypothetical protein IKN54_00150, partial [Lachnospiraceae bacterium]|nr:hypothetical protein [Lachnospiraceae bacterium]